MSGRRPPDDAELIGLLGELGPRVAWPATPDLAGRVVAAIEAGPARVAPTGVVRLARLSGGLLRGLLGSGRPDGRRLVARSLLLAVIALLTLVVIGAALGLGVPGIRIDLRPIPSPSAEASAEPSARGTGASIADTPSARPTPPGPEIGPTVSLADARREAGFGVLLPNAAPSNDPPEAHLAGTPPFTRVTLVYRDRSTLTEFLGAVQPDAFGKIVGPGTTVEPVTIGGSTGYWISGAPHELILLYRDADGIERWQQVTVSGNVLIWQVGSLTLRLETPLDREAAIALAQSTR